jgi:hypothetical protein
MEQIIHTKLDEVVVSITASKESKDKDKPTTEECKRRILSAHFHGNKLILK